VVFLRIYLASWSNTSPRDGERCTARFGPTTPTRAGRLADASVDPTDARNKFIETGATVVIGEDRLTVTLDRRCHNPILREAALDRDPQPIPWIGRTCGPKR
jgi:hypothetical protein